MVIYADVTKGYLKNFTVVFLAVKIVYHFL